MTEIGLNYFFWNIHLNVRQSIRLFDFHFLQHAVISCSSCLGQRYVIQFFSQLATKTVDLLESGILLALGDCQKYQVNPLLGSLYLATVIAIIDLKPFGCGSCGQSWIIGFHLCIFHSKSFLMVCSFHSLEKTSKLKNSCSAPLKEKQQVSSCSSSSSRTLYWNEYK